jgi:hypothetical protein
VGEREARIATNEALFRSVNEEMRALEPARAGSDELELVCECGRLDCAERLSLTLEDYEWVRADPHRFALLPGHVEREAERVVGEGDGWVAVEKREGAAAEIAVETDTRS